MAVHSHANHSSYKITTSVRLRTAAPSSSMLLVFACSESSYLSESKRDRHISPLSSDFNGFLSQVSNLSFLTSTSTSVKQTPQHKNLLRQEVLSGFQGNTPKTQPYSTFTKCKLQHFRFTFRPMTHTSLWNLLDQRISNRCWALSFHFIPPQQWREIERNGKEPQQLEFARLVRFVSYETNLFREFW